LKVAVIGRGRVGKALSSALERTKIRTRLLTHRQGLTDRLDVDLVVLAIPGPALAGYVRDLAGELPRGTAVVHCSGAHGVEVLEPLRRHRTACGVLHPLVSFASLKPLPYDFSGKVFVVSRGSSKLFARVRPVVKALGADLLIHDAHGPAYHAAASLVAGGSAALVADAVAILEGLGLSRRDSEHALAGLLRSVADNVEHVGVPQALTGSIARGDGSMVALHRESISPTARETYDAIAPAILRVARAQGLPRELADVVARALEGKPPRPARKRKRRS
jgi:predicted short-subunit dehydrogenase-like oxidoreductase (DUF2520 family)